MLTNRTRPRLPAEEPREPDRRAPEDGEVPAVDAPQVVEGAQRDEVVRLVAAAAISLPQRVQALADRDFQRTGGAPGLWRRAGDRRSGGEASVHRPGSSHHGLTIQEQCSAGITIGRGAVAETVSWKADARFPRVGDRVATGPRRRSGPSSSSYAIAW
jgi:hypothetical protein